MSDRDYYGTLYGIVDGLNSKFPHGNNPFQIVTRLCEEVGELAQAVNHVERTGIKVEKYGPPDKTKLADEVHHVLRAALSVARYYSIEEDVKDSIDAGFERLKDHGYLK